MIKKLRTFIALLAIAGIMSSCSVTLPVTATGNEVGSKVGKAEATGVFGTFFFNQDASIQTAAQNGGITEISTVDIRHGNVLNLIVTYETIVTGE